MGDALGDAVGGLERANDGAAVEDAVGRDDGDADGAEDGDDDGWELRASVR